MKITGIAPNDVIQSINGFTFSKKGLEWAASQNISVHLEILRGHRILSFTINPKHFRKMKNLIWKGNASQAKEIGLWLNTDDFNPNDGQKFALDFYDNFHGVETLV